MEISRRRLLQAGSSAAAVVLNSRPMWAQTYPARPVRILVGFPAGGLTDIAARLIGQQLSAKLGQQFVVENRPGAGSNIATEAALLAAPDGYTLLLATPLNAINASVYKKLNFNFMRDAAPVATIVDAAFVLETHPSVPAKTVTELVAYAKANPGRLKMASAGTGSPEHVAGELFMMATGVTMLHVPYRGSGEYLVDLVAGHVQIVIGPVAPSMQYIRTGALRALAVTTAAPSPALPGVPPINTVLPAFELSAWQGLCAPKDTPESVIATLNNAVNAALADPALQARFAGLGATIHPSSPSAFASLIAADTAKWAKVVKFADIKID